MAHAARVLGGLLLGVVSVGSCSVGTACHYGAHYSALTSWLLSRTANPATETSCFSYECRDRRAQILLSHPPVNCDLTVVTAWNELKTECGSVGGICCSNCTLDHATFCDVGLPASNRYPVTAYAGVATFLAVIALSWGGKPPQAASASFAPRQPRTDWKGML